MAERSHAIVGSSIVSRWYLGSPPHAEAALRVRDDVIAEEISLFAPENLLHEVTGAIHQAVFARKIDARRGLVLLDQFLALDLPLIQTDELVRPAFGLSLRYGRSYYDAIYLEIARRENYPFVHADLRLKNALAGRSPVDLWIEDYR